MPQNASPDRRGPQLARPPDAPLPMIHCELAEYMGYPMSGAGTSSVDALLAYQAEVATGVVVLDGDDDNTIHVWDAFADGTAVSKLGFLGREGLRGSMSLAIWMADAKRYELLSLDHNVLPITMDSSSDPNDHHWPDTELPHYLVPSGEEFWAIYWATYWTNEFWSDLTPDTEYPQFYRYDERSRLFFAIGGPGTRPDE